MFYKLAAVTLFTLVSFSFSSLRAQSIFAENFDYSSGNPLTDFGWTQIRNGDPILILSPGLEYDNYSLSGIGNAIQITHDGGQEVKKSFNPVSSDSLYCSFLVNISDASTNIGGGLFLYLTPADGSIFSFRFTIYTRMNDSDKVAFGIGTGSGLRFSGFDYELDQTHLIVMKYQFIPDEEDSTFLWINPDLSSPEPEPLIKSQAAYDLPEISEIILSQLTASNEPPDASVDGIQISSTWETMIISDIAETRFLTPEYDLKQNYPNPFNPVTTIPYRIAEAGHVTLKVYDVNGSLVRTLVDKYQTANHYAIAFDASQLSTGIYFYELCINNYKSYSRMIFLK